MTTLPVPVAPAEVVVFQNHLASAAQYALAEKSDATRRAYASDWSDFAGWAAGLDQAVAPASAATVAAYLASLADRGLKASTIVRRGAAIGYTHRIAGHEAPTNAEAVKAVLRGIKRRLGVALERKVPATARAIGAMLKKVPDTLTCKRDRAVLLLGFAAALRRSEIVGLTVGDLERTPDGLFVHIRRSKTDQEGEGHIVAIPRGGKLKPVEDWLAAAGIMEGRVFDLTDRTVANIVKRYAEAAKLDLALFSGHSLRAGFVTSALEAGADLLKVMDVTRHREVKTLKAYDRRAKAFKNHAGKGYIVNFSRSILHTGAIVCGMISHVYDTARTLRIVGEDGKVDLVEINQVGGLAEDGQPLDKIQNDVTVGAYDVAMDMGPSYTTGREAALDGMLQLVAAAPNLAPLVLDLLAKAQDWPMADKIAKRIRTMLPPQIQAQEAQESGEPPLPPMPPSPEQQAAMQAQERQQQLEAGRLQVDMEKLAVEREKIRTDMVKIQAEADRLVAEAQAATMQPGAPAADPRLDAITAALAQLSEVVSMIMEEMSAVEPPPPEPPAEPEAQPMVLSADFNGAPPGALSFDPGALGAAPARDDGPAGVTIL
ncbi:portal protein [Methylorubrum extorquens]|uniref:portal protein n=1 Tax=Methylorubrum extorquens TaxID=408 RepID=UPI0020A02716|nr:portal protein [Methylorubrum extorquens]MCP1539000.1 site-specific recombinase XerD [Methylorubrum extorquens]